MTSSDPRPFLVPVDFSPHAEAALLWACTVAQRVEAPIVVLHVVHDPEAAPGSYARRETEYPRRLEESAEEMLQNFLERVRADHPTSESLASAQARIAVGLPPNRIIEVAEAIDAQLIVMGSQGRTGLARFLLGSKAQRVAQVAPIPVTIVKASGNAPG